MLTSNPGMFLLNDFTVHLATFPQTHLMMEIVAYQGQSADIPNLGNEYKELNIN